MGMQAYLLAWPETSQILSDSEAPSECSFQTYLFVKTEPRRPNLALRHHMDHMEGWE